MPVVNHIYRMYTRPFISDNFYTTADRLLREALYNYHSSGEQWYQKPDTRCTIDNGNGNIITISKRYPTSKNFYEWTITDEDMAIIDKLPVEKWPRFKGHLKYSEPKMLPFMIQDGVIDASKVSEEHFVPNGDVYNLPFIKDALEISNRPLNIPEGHFAVKNHWDSNDKTNYIYPNSAKSDAFAMSLYNFPEKAASFYYALGKSDLIDHICECLPARLLQIT